MSVLDALCDTPEENDVALEPYRLRIVSLMLPVVTGFVVRAVDEPILLAATSTGATGFAPE